MPSILGKITQRVLNGDIPKNSLNPTRVQPKPSAKAVKGHTGHKLGTRKGSKSS